MHTSSLALIEMIDKIYANMDIKNVTIGIFLDLQKASDTVYHEIHPYKLHIYGIRGTVLDWFRDYLSNRQQYITLADIHLIMARLLVVFPKHQSWVLCYFCCIPTIFKIALLSLV